MEKSSKIDLKTVILIASLLMLAVEQIIVPKVNSGELAKEVHAQAVEIGKIQTAIKPLEGLPVQVAEIKTLVQTHMQNDKEKK